MNSPIRYYLSFRDRYYPRLREEKGQSLAEYALILGLIAVVSIAAVTLLGNHVSTLMNNVASNI